MASNMEVENSHFPYGADKRLRNRFVFPVYKGHLHFYSRYNADKQQRRRWRRLICPGAAVRRSSWNITSRFFILIGDRKPPQVKYSQGEGDREIQSAPCLI